MQQFDVPICMHQPFTFSTFVRLFATLRCDATATATATANLDKLENGVLVFSEDCKTYDESGNAKLAWSGVTNLQRVHELLFWGALLRGTWYRMDLGFRACYGLDWRRQKANWL